MCRGLALEKDGGVGWKEKPMLTVRVCAWFRMVDGRMCV